MPTDTESPTHNVYTDMYLASPTHETHFGEEKHLLWFRWFAFLWLLSEWLTLIIDKGFVWTGVTLVALTQEGMLGATVYFGVAIIDHLCGRRWVKTTHMFNFTAMTIEFLIFVFFWTVLFPGLMLDADARAKIQEQGVVVEWGMFAWHFFPFTFLLIDSLWNRNLWELGHSWLPVTLLMIYVFGVNCTFTLATGRPIYPVLTWKSWWTAFWLVMGVALSLLGMWLTVV